MEEENIEENENIDGGQESEKTKMSINNNPDKTGFSKTKEKIKGNPWIIVSVVLGIVVLLLVINMFVPFMGITGNVISESDAGEKILDFADSQGVAAELVEVNKKSGLYEIILFMQGREVPVYVTMDGENLVSGLTPLSLISSQNSNQQQPADIPKTDKPKVELFVMSFCPYGNRAEDTMLPVYNLLKDKVDWNINYIVSVSGDNIRSLHGQPETDQDIREVCVKKQFGLDKFWKFVTYVNKNCGGDGSCWKDAAKEAGVDANKIQSCFDKEGIELMKTEAQISNETGASGSPTLIINGVNSRAVYQYENPEAYKQAICSAFNEMPEGCNIVLEGSSSGAGSGGSC